MEQSVLDGILAGEDRSNMSIDETLRRKYLSIVESGKAVFFVLDGAGAIQFVSDYIKEVIAYDAKELPGRNIYDLLDEPSTPRVAEAMRSLRKDTTKPVSLHGIGIYCKEQKRHYFDGLIVYSELLTQSPYILYLHDITDRKLREDELASRNIELGQFVQKASHDLRAPLVSLEGLLNLAEHEGASGEYLQLMRASVTKLSRYISNVSKYSTAQQPEAPFEVIQLREFIQHIVDSLRFSPRASNFRFDIIVNGPATITSDAFRLEQILTNVISNAIKYRDPGKSNGLLEIIVHSGVQAAYFILRDNGIGIAEDSLGKIFQPYQRATNQAEGLGIGLHLVQGAVDSLDGQISVTSRAGLGTEFIIRIPNGRSGKYE